jgi:hypothetical protein
MFDTQYFSIKSIKPSIWNIEAETKKISTRNSNLIFIE